MDEKEAPIFFANQKKNEQEEARRVEKWSLINGVNDFGNSKHTNRTPIPYLNIEGTPTFIHNRGTYYGSR